MVFLLKKLVGILKQPGKVMFTDDQFSWCSALNETLMIIFLVDWSLHVKGKYHGVFDISCSK